MQQILLERTTTAPSPDTHLTPETAHAAATLIRAVQDQVSSVIIEKNRAIRLLLASLLSGGHVLLEDTPGVGKTTLAQALSIALGLECKRIPFTADMIPGDLTGAAIFDRTTGQFRFQPGPIFAQVILADEINRANEKAQSALLEAMEERRVTVDGVAHDLPENFLVIATQNPSSHSGTFDLPESQRDRFLLSMSLGYPSPQAEVRLLMGENPRARLTSIKAAVNSADIRSIRRDSTKVHVSEALAKYVLKIAETTRSGGFVEGLSPRALMGMMRAAKVLALMDGRTFVTPADIKSLYPWVAAHRLIAVNGEAAGGSASANYHSAWLNAIPCESMT